MKRRKKKKSTIRQPRQIIRTLNFQHDDTHDIVRTLLKLESLPLCLPAPRVIIPAVLAPLAGTEGPPSLPLDAEPDGDNNPDLELQLRPNFFLSPLTERLSAFLGDGGTRFP